MSEGASRPFGREIESFLSFKRGMGFKYEEAERSLARFQDLCESRGWGGPSLEREFVDEWCAKWPHESPRRHEGRVSTIRQFALYLNSVGVDAYVPAEAATATGRRARYSAHVFTLDEVDAIMDACDRLCPHRRSTMHLVLPTLVRLLYSAGTRVGEALSIRMGDVDLDAGSIRLLHAKNGKVRLVALSESMTQVLRTYCGILHPNPSEDDFLFRRRDGGGYSSATVYARFREVLADAGIPHGGRGAGPRLHDLRHTFACHTLMRASRSGLDVRALLPVLSIYLGHESVRETELYLKMTAEVFPDVVALVEDACAHVIPEVSGDGQGAY